MSESHLGEFGYDNNALSRPLTSVKYNAVWRIAAPKESAAGQNFGALGTQKIVGTGAKRQDLGPALLLVHSIIIFSSHIL